jgi:SAM-dependent methyltransferase
VNSTNDTRSPDYTARLRIRGGVVWKRILDVQRPYRWNLRRQNLGRTLDIGCGIGRNLTVLPAGSVGVDHNPTSVETARKRGLEAYTPEEFFARDWDPFDDMLLAHVIEHLTATDTRDLLRDYLPKLRVGGRVFMICPEERGYASDPTHVQWTTGDDLEHLARDVGLMPGAPKSFPFPRWAGRWFTYNEFTLLAQKPADTAP